METELTLYGIDLFVEYDYQHGEPATRDYPGSPAYINIDAVYISGTDWNIISELSARDEEQIEEHIKRIHE